MGVFGNHKQKEMDSLRTEVQELRRLAQSQTEVINSQLATLTQLLTRQSPYAPFPSAPGGVPGQAVGVPQHQLPPASAAAAGPPPASPAAPPAAKPDALAAVNSSSLFSPAPLPARAKPAPTQLSPQPKSPTSLSTTPRNPLPATVSPKPAIAPAHSPNAEKVDPILLASASSLFRSSASERSSGGAGAAAIKANPPPKIKTPGTPATPERLAESLSARFTPEVAEALLAGLDTPVATPRATPVPTPRTTFERPAGPPPAPQQAAAAAAQPAQARTTDAAQPAAARDAEAQAPPSASGMVRAASGTKPPPVKPPGGSQTPTAAPVATPFAKALDVSQPSKAPETQQAQTPQSAGAAQEASEQPGTSHAADADDRPLHSPTRSSMNGPFAGGNRGVDSVASSVAQKAGTAPLPISPTTSVASTQMQAASVQDAAAFGSLRGLIRQATFHGGEFSPDNRSNGCGPLPKRIILMRHGESQGNVDATCYTHLPDAQVGLTDRGYVQAKHAGRRLRAMLGTDGQPYRVFFYVSPYRRCKQTVDGLLRVFLPDQVLGVREEVQLREQDFGNFVDPSMQQQVKADRLKFGRFFYRFPNGESGADVFDRLSIFMDNMLNEINCGMFDEDTTLVLVTHGLAIRIFLMRWFHWSLDQFLNVYNPPNAEPVVLELAPPQEQGAAGKPCHTRAAYRLTEASMAALKGVRLDMTNHVAAKTVSYMVVETPDRVDRALSEAFDLADGK